MNLSRCSLRGEGGGKIKGENQGENFPGIGGRYQRQDRMGIIRGGRREKVRLNSKAAGCAAKNNNQNESSHELTLSLKKRWTRGV